MINIVIPMAGSGKKFAEKGYTFPKPLIEIKGKPMIEWVVKNLTPSREHRFIFICNREHYEKYRLGAMLTLLSPSCKTVILNAPTQGAASTILLAKEYLDNGDELIVANSDQYVNASLDDMIKTAEKNKVDGLIMTFKSTHPKWSFAKVGPDGLVMETAEKNPISEHATVGIYYFKQGKDFIAAAENMIKKDIRTNNEFYVCPVYNELILRDKKINIYEIPPENMFSWGTPEDLEYFLTTSYYKEKFK
jgi:NDP-sugar pyrophosphorylase family protein